MHVLTDLDKLKICGLDQFKTKGDAGPNVGNGGPSIRCKIIRNQFIL